MQSTPQLDSFLPFVATARKNAYKTFQLAKSVGSLAHKSASTELTKLVTSPTEKPLNQLSPEIVLKIQKLHEDILEKDWEDAQNGYYPHSILFENDWQDFVVNYPQIWLDLPKIWQRLNQKKYHDFDPQIDQEGYPKYYLQNFHHQTDGYLGDQSAELYDLQVEIVFNGAANAMRRRIIPPLKQGLQAFKDVLPQQTRILDIACGTGMTLRNLRAAFPKASLFGVDLSPAYLRKANQILAAIPGTLPQLAQANAEKLPYTDNYFHGTSCVFLFHELPPNARQAVINEAFRVTKPGGTFIICDSIQKFEYPDFEPIMENFPAMFHEPYYRHYTTDNLNERLETAGFVNIETQNHFMSKYWIARKAV
ncbi:MAG: methyltransferase domain-containing protein [Jaaginema sp. PMC 1079.18]|nr:methyltransferase domain-containing protein [Jaaginema sp. PMC 1080.18]MEC4853207.1 methyltransferase domain-containing protein [Jaaginema sp. PMC 1079.18]MEC4866150.1 methyltransferase domain-containing protein [Jaaginema sp. PMC 1078.18]